MRRLNELLEQSCLQNDWATQLESQLIKDRSEVSSQLSQVQVDAELKIESLLSQTTHLKGEILKMFENLKQAHHHLESLGRMLASTRL